MEPHEITPLRRRLAAVCLWGCATSAAYAFVLFMTVVK
ncbi:hypothetical protein EDC40_103676 [Aminobacter aminovorans]|jgi:hypothetical protein|uniref:Uncharacterized protein n=1 Tax=Aminobacter aminovorans TaxID=83263 RepID=A0A380WM49_AMIAI|nr:hypothetical protein EDC40_103676 [Aminobacter aminovorans]SUU89382.1 Uncharacterised protein [Aminobacter aminovorans]